MLPLIVHLFCNALGLERVSDNREAGIYPASLDDGIDKSYPSDTDFVV
ncbi:hypothetical protein LJPFL01_2241 [Lelliottia jeotgali]|nr:hypothetical protein LJPFL01_2241 [Lelliottia jeotgali]